MPDSNPAVARVRCRAGLSNITVALSRQRGCSEGECRARSLYRNSTVTDRWLRLPTVAARTRALQARRSTLTKLGSAPKATGFAGLPHAELARLR